jgi:hypothetical protein
VELLGQAAVTMDAHSKRTTEPRNAVSGVVTDTSRRIKNKPRPFFLSPSAPARDLVKGR